MTELLSRALGKSPCVIGAALAVLIGLLATVALHSVDAAAQSPGPGPAVDRCAGSPSESTLLACRRDGLATAAAELDRLGSALAATYGKDEPRRAELLRRSQEAWSAFRDADCALRTADSASGTAHEIYLTSCLADLTQQRVGELTTLRNTP